MTHPDIIMTERFGGVYPQKPAAKIGECLYCEASVFDDSGDAVESGEGIFCDMECCCEYYEIRSLCD